VQAIVEIGDPKAVEPLINALNDADWEVREKVAEALDKIRSRAVQL
jgi:HEAT repeat protein